MAFGSTDDEDPILPPRMAYELMIAAAYFGDMLDGDDCSSFDNVRAVLPGSARQFFPEVLDGTSANWRKSFQQCYFRIYVRLRNGQMPTPNCIGEEVVLHTLFDYVEENEHPFRDPIYWALPEFRNDDDYNAAFFSLREQDLHHPSLPRSHVRTFLRTYVRICVCVCSPEQWFEAFYPERFWAEIAQHSPDRESESESEFVNFEAASESESDSHADAYSDADSDSVSESESSRESGV